MEGWSFAYWLLKHKSWVEVSSLLLGPLALLLLLGGLGPSVLGLSASAFLLLFVLLAIPSMLVAVLGVEWLFGSHTRLHARLPGRELRDAALLSAWSKAQRKAEAGMAIEISLEQSDGGAVHRLLVSPRERPPIELYLEAFGEQYQLSVRRQVPEAILELASPSGLSIPRREEFCALLPKTFAEEDFTPLSIPRPGAEISVSQLRSSTPLQRFLAYHQHALFWSDLRHQSSDWRGLHEEIWVDDQGFQLLTQRCRLDELPRRLDDALQLSTWHLELLQRAQEPLFEGHYLTDEHRHHEVVWLAYFWLERPLHPGLVKRVARAFFEWPTERLYELHKELCDAGQEPLFLDAFEGFLLGGWAECQEQPPLAPGQASSDGPAGSHFPEGLRRQPLQRWLDLCEGIFETQRRLSIYRRIFEQPLTPAQKKHIVLRQQHFLLLLEVIERWSREIGVQKARELLLGWLGHPSSQMVLLALGILSRPPWVDISMEPELLALLSHPSTRVRLRSLQVLSAVATAASIPALLSAMESWDPTGDEAALRQAQKIVEELQSELPRGALSMSAPGPQGQLSLSRSPSGSLSLDDP